MKNISILLILVYLLVGCNASEVEITTTEIDVNLGRSPNSEKFCGDGICDGPEAFENCPDDCQQQPIATIKPASDIPPLYFFYAIHAHGSKEFLPYTDPGMTIINPEVAENMIAAIEGIAAILDKHGVKGTWEFLPATINGIASYQGENNIFEQLVSRGHEIAIHAHKIEDVSLAVQALQACCAISPKTSSGFIAQISNVGLDEVQSAMSEAISVPVNLGLTVGTTNLSPGGEKNLFGSICNEKFGVENNMWAETGNLMFPWRPDYIHEDICNDNPLGQMLFVDHVSIEWLILPDAIGPPDVLDSRHFSQLKAEFDSAINYMENDQSERVAVWGFVTHIIEYAIGSDGENPPDLTALEALNEFLSYVDTKQKEGLVIYATASEIANFVSMQRP